MQTLVSRTLSAALALVLAAGLAACGGESEVGTAQRPLVLLLSPAHAPARSESLAAIQGELSTRSGMNVQLRISATPADAIAQFGTRRADAGILSLDEFLLAHEEYAVRPGLQVLRGKGETRYDGVILVPSKSKARSLADLGGKPFGFVDPYSVSGFLLPALALKKEGVTVEPRFLDSHALALEALLKGEVAAVATYGAQASGRKDVRVLTRTGTMPNEPVVFRGGLRPEKREALEKALAGLAADPETVKLLLSLANITGFGPADNDAYRSVHDLLRDAGKSVYDIVPGSAEILRLNEPYVDLR